MGSRGPVPKRNAERRRRNLDVRADSASWAGGPVEIPEPDPAWHSIATQWYTSLAESGQSQFYEPSDWALAFLVAEVMTRNLGDAKFNAQLFSSIMSAMTELLTSEGARRRARIEIERTAELAPVDDLAAYRGLVS